MLLVGKVNAVNQAQECYGICLPSFFAEQHLHYGLSNGLECVFVDMLHRVVNGVPGGAEAALWAVGVEGNDVDGWYFGVLVHGNVVVGDIASVLSGEVTAIACRFGCRPNLLHDVGCILLGGQLLVEFSPLSAYHVQQYAVFGAIVV